MLTSPLSEALLARGATIGDGDPHAEPGVRLVRHHGDVDGEHRALRAEAVVVDASHRGLLVVSGHDRVRFLQSMTTADLASLQPGHGAYGAFLNDRGRVVADATAFVLGDEIWLDLEAAAREKLPPILDRFIIMDDVLLADRTAERALIGVHGPAALAVAGRALGIDLAGLTDLECVATPRGTLWRRDRYGVPGVELATPSAQGLSIHDAFAAAGARPAGENALERARVEAGLPRAFIDADESTILLEAGLEHVVSRSKGCYLGQEVIVRAQDRGGVKKVLAGLVVHGAPPARGSVVHAGEREVGRVTSSIAVTPERALALAILHRDAARGGDDLRVGTLTARVAPLPFPTEAR